MTQLTRYEYTVEDLKDEIEQARIDGLEWRVEELDEEPASWSD